MENFKGILLPFYFTWKFEGLINNNRSNSSDASELLHIENPLTEISSIQTIVLVIKGAVMAEKTEREKNKETEELKQIIVDNIIENYIHKEGQKEGKAWRVEH
ncbi:MULTISPECIES: hypothetical protein [Clostridia]|nr:MULTISPECIES: hypothetical protein [Clostridia]